MGASEKEDRKTYSIRISAKAQLHIEEISWYIAYIEHQPRNAIRVAEYIYETIDKIAIFPYAFSECEEIITNKKNYRRAVCLNWLIIYKIHAKHINILGIIHGARKPSNLLQNR